MNLTKKDIIDKITKNKQNLLEFGIIKIGLFGSFVKEKATSESDIDLYIEIKTEYKSLKNYIAIHDFLRNLFLRNIDLVTPQSLNKFTGNTILNEVEYVSAFD